MYENVNVSAGDLLRSGVAQQYGFDSPARFQDDYFSNPDSVGYNNVYANIMSNYVYGDDGHVYNDPEHQNKLGAYFNNKLTGDLDVANALKLQHDAQSFESKEAQINRDWQQHNIENAYQIAAADLKAAGFNPALLLGSGAPQASVTSGSYAHSAVAHTQPVRGFDQMVQGIFSLIGLIVGAGLKSSALQVASAATNAASKAASSKYSYNRPSLYSKSVGNGRYVSTYNMFD